MDPITPELNPAGQPTTGGFRTSEQIRSDIEARRAEMDVLATCLRQRLSPKEIADEVKRNLRGRSHRMAGSVVSSMRDNPLPWLVVGSGLAMLVQQSRKSKTSDLDFGYRTGDYGTQYGSVLGTSLSSGLSGSRMDVGGDYRAYGSTEVGLAPSFGSSLGYEPGSGMSSGQSSASEVFDRVKDKAVQAKDVVSEKAHHAGEVVSEKAHQAREAVTETAHQAAEVVGRKAHQAREAVSQKATAARESLSDMGHRTSTQARLLTERARLKATTTANDSPLWFTLGLIGVGALIGLAIPTSRREDELMGPMRDDLLEQAKSKGREVAHKVSRVAEVATTEAKQQVTSPEGGDPGEKIVSAVEGVVDAARREAERQGLTSSENGGNDGHRGPSTSGGSSSGLSSGTSGGSASGLSPSGSSGTTAGASGSRGTATSSPASSLSGSTGASTRPASGSTQSSVSSTSPTSPSNRPVAPVRSTSSPSSSPVRSAAPAGGSPSSGGVTQPSVSSPGSTTSASGSPARVVPSGVTLGSTSSVGSPSTVSTSGTPLPSSPSEITSPSAPSSEKRDMPSGPGRGPNEPFKGPRR